jgi:hypothetical protein
VQQPSLKTAHGSQQPLLYPHWLYPQPLPHPQPPNQVQGDKM